MFLNKSFKSLRKKKNKSVNNEKSERKKRTPKKKEGGSMRVRKSKKKCDSADMPSTAATSTVTTTGTFTQLAEVDERGSKFERPEKKSSKVESWNGEESAKQLVATGVFNMDTLPLTFRDISSKTPSLDDCPRFKQNVLKARAPDFPIPDDKLVKLQHAPENFICAAKINVPEFRRTMILSQVPDVTMSANIEDFWRMVFHVLSVVIAVMPLELSVTLQQLFPIASGSFANHGKMFLNNKKVESSVAMTAYTLELLPDGCSNSVNTTVYHLHNWKPRRGLENVGELVSIMEKLLKVNENMMFMSMHGTGRAGTMLTLFAAMLNINKDKEVKTKELLEKLRHERSGVVESPDQFVTIHKALALWFKKKSQDEELQKKIADFGPNP